MATFARRVLLEDHEERDDGHRNAQYVRGRYSLLPMGDGSKLKYGFTQLGAGFSKFCQFVCHIVQVVYEVAERSSDHMTLN